MVPPPVLTEAIRLMRPAPTLWPGFTPATIPALVFDGGVTWLDGATPQDDGWEETGDRWRFPGCHPALSANTAVTLPGGALAAGVLLPSLGDADAVTVASVLLHEAFHVYQRAHPRPAWQADELAALTYPATNPEVLHARAEETQALADALGAADWAPHARRALHWRQVRSDRLTPEHRTFESRMETAEGLAEYIETRFLGTFPPLDATDAARMNARQWAYHSGAALAHLLRRSGADWMEAVEGGTPLHARLGKLVGPPATPPQPTPALRHAAEVAAHTHTESLRRLEATFAAQPGERLTVTSAAGFPVTALDPMNVTRLDGTHFPHACFLHTRFLSLNLGADSTFRLSGASALTHGPGLWRPTVVEVRGLPLPDTSSGRWVVQDDRWTIQLPADRVQSTPDGWRCRLD
ncbi:hypothetical protein ACMT4L_19440 [Deinococcus sp. A31D244]|uniref:hypothetical protein n=1 Tax=Deinococcus sp. A31D244 TaxID=3397675 RepID=UPI0039E13DD4